MSPSIADKLQPERVKRALARRVRLARVARAAAAIRMGERGRGANGHEPSSAATAADAGLISEEYQDLNQQMHREREGYGVQAVGHLAEVRILMRAVGDDVLDYGCGKRLLEQNLGIPVQNYDPGIPGLDAPPRPADLVACLDVLEHIEPDAIDTVLDDLRRVTRRAGYFVVSTQPATKSLPDGRNAHLIVESPEWWQERLAQRFDVKLRIDEPDHATFVVQPR